MKRIALVNSRWHGPSTERPLPALPDSELKEEVCRSCGSSLDILDCPFCWGSEPEHCRPLRSPEPEYPLRAA